MPYFPNRGTAMTHQSFWYAIKKHARAAGIGVQFNAQDDTAMRQIETYLAGALESDRPTHTM